MKKISILLGVCVLLPVLLYSFPRPKSGQMYLFGDNVNIRKKPETGSQVIYQGDIAEKLTVLSQDTETLTVDGLTDYWYKVKINGKEGYVWGGLIADRSYRDDFDRDGDTDFLLIRNFSEGPYSQIKDSSLANAREPQAEVQMRIVYNSHYVELESDKNDWHNAEYTIRNIDFKKYEGFSSAVYLLSVPVKIKGELFGTGVSYYVIDGDNFDAAFRVINVGEGGSRREENAVFPADPGGKENRVRIITKHFDADGSDDEMLVSERVTVYVWKEAQNKFVKEGD